MHRSHPSHDSAPAHPAVRTSSLLTREPEVLPPDVRLRPPRRDLSQAIATIYAEHYGRPGITATTSFEPDRVLCMVRNPLTADERKVVAAGERRRVLAGRSRFQFGWRDELTDLVESRARRPVSAFLSSDEVDPAVAADIFFLASDTAPVTVVAEGELDRRTTPALERVLSREIASGTGELKLDLSRVTFVAPVGLHLINRLNRLASERGRVLSIALGCSRAKRALSRLDRDPTGGAG